MKVACRSAMVSDIATYWPVLLAAVVAMDTASRQYPQHVDSLWSMSL